MISSGLRRRCWILRKALKDEPRRMRGEVSTVTTTEEAGKACRIFKSPLPLLIRQTSVRGVRKRTFYVASSPLKEAISERRAVSFRQPTIPRSAGIQDWRG